MPTSVRLTGDWKKLERQLSSEVFREKISTEMRRATRTNAFMVRREVRLNLRDGNHARNAPLTTFIKGSTRPLIGPGPGAQLFQSIHFRSQSPFRAEIGVLKGDTNANIAIIVHEGATIPVTPAMRGMFAALQDASEGRREPGTLRGRARDLYGRRPKGWKALKPTTVAIRIPARPFIRQVVEREDLNRAVGRNWLAAAAAAIAGTRAQLRTDV
jgi:hypothetical protein